MVLGIEVYIKYMGEKDHIALWYWGLKYIYKYMHHVYMWMGKYYTPGSNTLILNAVAHQHSDYYIHWMVFFCIRKISLTCRFVQLV